MVSPNEEKAVIKNDFIEEEWSAYLSCKSIDQWIGDLVHEDLKR